MRKKMVAAALAVTAAVGAALGGASPAVAAGGQLSVYCHPKNSTYEELRASAWYTVYTAGYHYWTGTSFRLDGGAVNNESNIDIWVYGGNKVWAHRGADNIAGNYTYTSTAHPKFALNVSTPDYLADEHVAFKAVFDIEALPDSDCSAVTHNI